MTELYGVISTLGPFICTTSMKKSGRDGSLDSCAKVTVDEVVEDDDDDDADESFDSDMVL